MEYEFSMALRVDDVEALYAAASAHEDNPGDDILRPYGEIDVSACLITLLDPGSVEGCSVHDSTATEIY